MQTLLLSLLLLLSIIGAVFMIRLVRKKGKDDKAAALLLFCIVFEYWVWWAFAEFADISSYIYWILIEILRIIIIMCIFLYIVGRGGIRRAWNFFMSKYYIFDFTTIICYYLFWRSSLRGLVDINHPLFMYALGLVFFIHLYLIAFYMVKLRD